MTDIPPRAQASAPTLPHPLPTATPEDLVSSGEARQLVGVSLRTFERYVSAGLLTPYRRTPTARRRFSAAQARELGTHRASTVARRSA